MKQIRLSIYLIAIAFAVACAVAQTPTGTVQGTVTDPTGAAIQSATITVVHNSTNEAHTVTTDASGRFILPFVEPGTYNVSVEAKGFRTE